jgi:hypothetical protein
MARSRAGPPRRVVDLKGILSTGQRDDLATLVLRILDKIGHQITDAFDSHPVTPVETKNPNHGWIALQLQGRENDGFPNRPLSPLGVANKPNNGNASAAPPSSGRKGRPLSKAHQIIEKEEQEAMTPQLQELKKELSVVYKKWQMFVTNRIRDVKVTEEAQPGRRGEDGASAVAGRGGRWGNRGGRGDGRGGGRGRGGLSTPPGKSEKKKP